MVRSNTPGRVHMYLHTQKDPLQFIMTYQTNDTREVGTHKQHIHATWYAVHHDLSDKRHT